MHESNNNKECVKHSFHKGNEKELKKKVETSHNKTLNIKALLGQTEKNVKLNQYKGPFCLSCVTMKNPLSLLYDMKNSFDKFRIKFRNQEEFFLICEKENVNFEMEIMQLEEKSGLNYIRLKNLNSDSDKLRDLVMKILACNKI